MFGANKQFLCISVLVNRFTSLLRSIHILHCIHRLLTYQFAFPMYDLVSSTCSPPPSELGRKRRRRCRLKNEFMFVVRILQKAGCVYHPLQHWVPNGNWNNLPNRFCSQTMQTLVISRCGHTNDGLEMYKVLKCTR